MAITLFIIGSLILANAYLSATLAQIQDKVDINVYFKPEATESEILSLRSKLQNLPEVREVAYVTREESLEQFRKRNEGNELIIQSLSVLNDNPLGAVFNIKAKDPSQYGGIAEFLDQKSEESLLRGEAGAIDNINYYKNQVVIERLSKIITGTKSIGLIVSIILAVMAVLVTFNTIRLAIYNAREEIGIMQLVGANYGYIRGPFVVEGIMYGFVSGLIALAFLYPASLWVSRSTASYFLASAEDAMFVFNYFVSNFLQMFMVLIALGVVLGTISSMVAVRRHLK